MGPNGSNETFELVTSASSVIPSRLRLMICNLKSKYWDLLVLSVFASTFVNYFV